MSSPHRVCLLGFSDFERRALALQFRLAAARTPAYELVATPQEARYLVVDADASAAVQRTLDAGRLGDAVFVGTGIAPAGAMARLRRPIDALSVLRELDAAVFRLQSPAFDAAPAPVRTVAAPNPSKPASAPEISRIVVPELPQSAVPPPLRRTSTAAIVERTSAPGSDSRMFDW